MLPHNRPLMDAGLLLGKNLDELRLVVALRKDFHDTKVRCVTIGERKDSALREDRLEHVAGVAQDAHGERAAVEPLEAEVGVGRVETLVDQNPEMLIIAEDERSEEHTSELQSPIH